MKLTNVVKDGKLPLKEDKVIKPWELLSVDLCGPWTIKCEFDVPKQIKTVKIWALTMIDEGSCWPEIMPIDNKCAENIAQIVDDQWFNRYPRSIYCIHDNGGEFIGTGFDEILQSYGVLPKSTMDKNPQSNGVYERMHLVLCEMKCTTKLQVTEHSTANKEINRVLQAAA